MMGNGSKRLIETTLSLPVSFVKQSHMYMSKPILSQRYVAIDLRYITIPSIQQNFSFFLPYALTLTFPAVSLGVLFSIPLKARFPPHPNSPHHPLDMTSPAQRQQQTQQTPEALARREAQRPLGHASRGLRKAVLFTGLPARPLRPQPGELRVMAMSRGVPPSSRFSPSFLCPAPHGEDTAPCWSLGVPRDQKGTFTFCSFFSSLFSRSGLFPPLSFFFFSFYFLYFIYLYFKFICLYLYFIYFYLL